jgi:hypothetical protein
MRFILTDLPVSSVTVNLHVSVRYEIDLEPNQYYLKSLIGFEVFIQMVLLN